MGGSDTSSPRKHYLDWLRVLGILVVFIYHSCRFFDANNPWHIKNPVTYRWLRLVLEFTEQWMMPLMIVISGAAVFYALGSRGIGKFVKARVLRLLVPLVVGIFTHSIWQIYLERLTHGQFIGSFWQFLPEYFKGLYGFGGNFAWMGVHLWYLLVLFVASLILLPFFWLFKTRYGSYVLHWVGNVLALPGAFYMVVVPTVVLIKIVGEDTLLGRQDFGGWSLTTYVWFLFGGFLLISHERLQERIRQFRWLSLALAILLGTVGFVWGIFKLRVPGAFGAAGAFLMGDTHDDLGSWLWILTWMGFAMQHLHIRARFIDHSNEAVLPFYILHQPVLLTVGYFVIPLIIAAALKWAIIMPASFVIIIVLYELLVRRFNVLRFLFGMKLLRRVQAARELTAHQG